VVESQRFIMGDQVRELEAAVAAASGARFGIACASGTDALLLSFKTLELAPGDEVITTPFTFFATAGAIHNAGGTPVFRRSRRIPERSRRCICSGSSRRWKRSWRSRPSAVSP
jgi:hypothetical protein